ncbi:hypothetical protein [Desulfofundulus kuznetsovii]|uniref:hypothetical protein n=1 Tax=Desulfofundulus kuznetsovii TaxID=58135 RepID=UPI000694DFA2
MSRVINIPARISPATVKEAARELKPGAAAGPTNMEARAIRVGKRPLQGTKLLVSVPELQREERGAVFFARVPVR